MNIFEECELKLLLSKQEYNLLLDNYAGKRRKEIIQTNYYFDTDNLLFHQMNITLRLREIEGKYFFTIKEKKHTNLDLHFRQSKEITQQLSINVAKKLICNYGNIFRIDSDLYEFFNNTELRYLRENEVNLIGSLSTKRCNFEYYEGELYLDENTYLNKCDWELEFETNNKSLMSNLFKELAENNVSIDKILQGKYSRFLSEYIKTHNG